MRPEILVFAIPIIGTIGFFTMIIFLRRYNNIERMSMIERGMNPDDISYNFKSLRRRERDPLRFLRIACAIVGVGVGLFVGNILRSIPFLDRGGIVAGLVCICGGIGLLLGFYIQANLQNKGLFQDKNQADDSDII